MCRFHLSIYSIFLHNRLWQNMCYISIPRQCTCTHSRLIYTLYTHFFLVICMCTTSAIWLIPFTALCSVAVCSFERRLCCSFLPASAFPQLQSKASTRHFHTQSSNGHALRMSQNHASPSSFWPARTRGLSLPPPGLGLTRHGYIYI